VRVEFDHIRLEFDAGWKAIRWDEHDDYRNGIARCAGSKAVDVVAYNHAQVVLIEGKDLRHQADDWNRMVVRSELAATIALKVKDTLAAFVALARTRTQPWAELLDRVTDGHPLAVVLWLERPDTYYSSHRYTYQLSIFTGQMKKQLSWLPNITVHVCGSKHNGVPGIKGV